MFALKIAQQIIIYPPGFQTGKYLQYLKKFTSIKMLLFRADKLRINY